MRLLNIVGARPQIIKAAAISRVIRTKYSDKIEEIIIHTGQHYDYIMSDIFFEQMEIPQPAENLGIGDMSHGKMTAEMIKKLEERILYYNPNMIVVYGDTNSTLATAIAAIKYYFPIAHVEAGLRSYNKKMPEEINRIVCDHCSALLFVPTKTAIKNLINEGFKLKSKPPYSPDNPGIFMVGDVMYDNFIYYSAKATKISNFLQKNNLQPNKFVLVTIHRNINTDNIKRIEEILSKLHILSEHLKLRIIFPIHPRTKKIIEYNNLFKYLKNIDVIEPLSFFDMLCAENNAALIITDSGGVQKEAYFAKKPCVVMRSETEWVEIVKSGAAMLEINEKDKFIESVLRFMSNSPRNFPEIFGKGNAAELICKIINDFSQ
ncbi:MAG: UDP-N-acetylglucosamine 2-epimerase (non-hydrolyzing) [Bacteroidales bacterium]|nr:UDP-N-acetylglucosamine 2-epimerase (non-hydrolyzing) [Bacteroidales bacterium]